MGMTVGIHEYGILRVIPSEESIRNIRNSEVTWSWHRRLYVRNISVRVRGLIPFPGSTKDFGHSLGFTLIIHGSDKKIE